MSIKYFCNYIPLCVCGFFPSHAKFHFQWIIGKINQCYFEIWEPWSLEHVSIYEARTEGSRMKGEMVISNYQDGIGEQRPVLWHGAKLIFSYSWKTDEDGWIWVVHFLLVYLYSYMPWWKTALYGLRNLTYKLETATWEVLYQVALTLIGIHSQQQVYSCG